MEAPLWLSLAPCDVGFYQSFEAVLGDGWDEDRRGCWGQFSGGGLPVYTSQAQRGSSAAGG